MPVRRAAMTGFLALAVLILGVAGAYAQGQSGTIAGVVRDSSGGVLPGVTVEAASPALIEKARSVVTDGQGRYAIVDLRPGTYAVSFMLTGFSTVKREGIELTTGFTANVNADLRVGAIEETVTVTGESPIVDTQSTRAGTGSRFNRPSVVDSSARIQMTSRRPRSMAFVMWPTMFTGPSSFTL